MFTSTGNRGLQVVNNTGAIEAHIYTERPETPPQPSCVVPHRRNSDFVDHNELLGQVHQRCSAPASRVALVGLGGVGKSQLATEYCYRTAVHSPDTWVFWAHANDTAQLEQSFRKIADQVKVRGRKDPQANVLKLVHDWLRDVRNGRWLLVLDNADNVAILSPTNGSSALQYLPPSSHGSVLVTSRTKRAAMQIVEDNEIIPVEPMDDESASALLRKKLRNISGETDDSSIAQLATELDRMPLALVQAAAYIRERAPRCSVQQYLDQYRQSDSRKISLLKREAGYLRRDQATSDSVLITWQISFDHIRNTRHSAADLLSLMSFFDRHRIQETLLRRRSRTADKCIAVVGTDDDFEDDVLTLRDYSFINVTKDTDSFDMHSLVQLATHSWLENEGQMDKWRNQFISNLCAELRPQDLEDCSKCEALLPHAQAALSQRPKDRRSLCMWIRLLHNAAMYLFQRGGRFRDAEQMLVASTEVRKDLLGEKHEETLQSMIPLAWVKFFAGKCEEAESMLRRMLAVEKKKVHKHRGHNTLANLKSMIALLSTLIKHQESELIHRQILTLFQEVLGHEHPDTLAIMSSLAQLLGKQGKYQESVVTQRRTLAISVKVLGDEHRDTLMYTHILGSLLLKQGKTEEADILLRQTLAKRKKVLGDEHTETVESMQDLAMLLHTQGKRKEAVALLRQTLTILEKVLGHEHIGTLLNVYHLAICLRIWNYSDESLSLFKRACVGSRNMLGKDHPVTVAYAKTYASALVSHQMYQQSLYDSFQTRPE